MAEYSNDMSNQNYSGESGDYSGEYFSEDRGDYGNEGSDEYLPDGGAAAYNSFMSKKPEHYQKQSGHARPSSAEIEASRMAQRHQHLQQFSSSSSNNVASSSPEYDEHQNQNQQHQHHQNQQHQQQFTSIRGRPDLSAEIEKSKSEQMKLGKPQESWESHGEHGEHENGWHESENQGNQENQESHVQARTTSHVRPDDAAVLSSMNDDGKHARHGLKAMKGESGESSTGESSAVQGDEVSDRDYLLRYFPGALEVYNYDENGHITRPSEVSLADRKIIKRAICGHWYFFTYGCAANEEKAKHLSTKLAKIKPDLSLTTHLKKKVTDSSWLK